MHPLVSFVIHFGLLGTLLILIHWISLAVGINDLFALLFLALPVVAFIAWCTQPTHRLMLRSATLIYTSFATVVLASAALVYLIG